MVSETTIPGHGGAVHCRTWTPSERPWGGVVIVHGYAEHGGRYAHVAERLVAEGLVVVAPDHVGHGRSEGERALITDFDLVVDDLALVIAAVEAAHPDIPLAMVGHSMGGLLTGRFIQRWPDRLAAAAFLGAVLGDWKWAREVLAQPEMPAADSNPEGMSRDLEACRAYADDPLVYHGTYKRGLLEAEVAALDAFSAQLDRIAIPLALFHGSADPFVPVADSLAAILGTASLDLRIKIYHGARHELVNETNRDEVLDDIRLWLKMVMRSPAG